MAEQADARDLKSLEGFLVRVRLPLPAHDRIEKIPRGGAIRKLVGLITRRLPVRIRPPQPAVAA
jgi:hypothetical protein